MLKYHFTFPVGQEKLAGTIIAADESTTPPQFVFIHGGGTAAYKEKVYDFAEPILRAGLNILTFDLSGHGQSTGELKKSSLKRVIESQALIDHFAKQPLTICGESMGGYIAIKMLELYHVETLILVCPALYDAKASDVRFDLGFTEIIRSPESWRNTDVLKTLEAYTGNLLVVMGENDEVIPPGVIELIMRHTPHARKKNFIAFPACLLNPPVDC